MSEADATSNPGATKRERRRFRAARSLRAMMLVVLVVACGMGWIGRQVSRARDVRRAIMIIERAGGWVGFDGSRDAAGRWIKRTGLAARLCDTLGEEYVFDVNLVAINEMKPGSDARKVFDAVASLPRVKHLSLAFLELGDEDMAAIARMADLEKIEILEPNKSMVPPITQATVSPLSPSGLARLSRLRTLRSIDLDLEPEQIDAHALDALSKLPHLRVLKITCRGALNDPEAQALGGFRHLEELDIRWYRPFMAPQIGSGDALEDPVASALRGVKYHIELCRPFEWGRTNIPLPISSWAGLRSLTIRSIDLWPDEVRAISRLAKLERLSAPGFRDEDLVLLREMKGLKTLHLSRWQRIKPESLASLNAALPGLTIIVF